MVNTLHLILSLFSSLRGEALSITQETGILFYFVTLPRRRLFSRVWHAHVFSTQILHNK